ncbi:MAG: hypothetical protein ACK5KO_13865 [Arachnia sp.]
MSDEAAPGHASAPRTSLMRRVMRSLAHLMPARADGTNPAAVRALHIADSVRERLRHGGAAWPVTSGAYTVGDPTGTIAVCVLTSDELYPALARLPGVAIAGRVVVPNLGIEKIVRNVASNPHIRELVLCGKDSAIFFPGEALTQLHADGVDQERRILGARGHLPTLTNVSVQHIERFRAQVHLTDLIGVTDHATIASRITELADAATGPYAGPLPADDDPFRTIRPGGRRDRLELDPGGFLVITADHEAGRIEVLHYLSDTTPATRVSGHSAEAILQAVLREGLITQLSHAGYVGSELAKAETALRLNLEYRQDRPLRG